MSKKDVGLNIMCLDDGEIYLGEVRKGKKRFRKDHKVNVTKEVLDAVANYMSLHIKDEDTPEYVLDVNDNKNNQKAVLTFRIIRDDEDVMFR